MNVYPHAHVSALGLGRKISEYAKCLLITASLLTGVLVPLRADTIGGGTISSPAVGPGPSYGLGGAGAVLVKNWDFGAGGTIKNNADLSANFYYHDQFNTISNKYGAKIVSPDAANALPGQPIEGVNCPTIREYTGDSIKTYLQPLNGATSVNPVTQKAGSGSFMAKWTLPNGGSLLGVDIVWETRVRMETPPYFWFALWTAGNAWNLGAEHDLVESFGYDNGGGNTNYDGRYWHSNAVRGSDVLPYTAWSTSMADAGVPTFDATQYHTWTWVYRADNSYAMYMDGILVQSGVTPYFWTLGAKETGVPINMSFLFDGSWGHTEISSVNKTLAASELAGKYYEFDYSRVYLVPLTQAPAVPAGLVVDAGHEEVLLSWTLASRATSYNVYRGTQSDGSDTALVASGLKNVVFTDKNLKNGTTYYYKVTGVNTIGESGQSTAIAATPILTYTIDDADSARCTYVGAWTASTSATGYFGSGYHHDANTGAVGGKRAIFTPTFLSSGIYNIYTRAPAGANRATNAPFDINHSDGTTTVAVNEQINDNNWVLLGAFPFNAGSSGNVTVRNDGADFFVMVDALRWVPTSIVTPSAAPSAPAGVTVVTGNKQVTLKWQLNTDPAAEASEYRIYRSTTQGDANPTLIGSVSNALTFTDGTVENGGLYYYTIVAANSVGQSPRSLEVGALISGEVGAIVDDVDASCTFTGAWTTSTFVAGSYGGSYHVGVVGDGKHATYKPTLPATGRYEVFMRWPAGTDRATNAPVDVFSSDTNLLSTVTVNQRNNNNAWVSLGIFDFSAGTSGGVTLRNDGADGTVIADAARWVLQTAPATVTLVNLTQIYDGNPKTASYTTSPAGLNAWISYNGSTTPPTAVGRYDVVATIYDPNYKGSTTATMLIAQNPSAAPSAPEGLTAVSGNKQVTLSWQLNANPAAEAFEYRIYRSLTHNDPSPALIATVSNVLSFTDTGLQAGTLYYYTLVAANNLGASPRSLEVGAVPTGDVDTYILDDASSSATYVGAWTVSTSNTGYYGTGYRHDANTGSVGGKRAKFTPTILHAGPYAVYTRAPAGVNRASNIQFDVNHAGGTTTVPVNEQINNNEWVFLGKFVFNAGTSGNVTVRNDGANGFVMVDAIRFVGQALDATVSLGNLTQTYDGTPKMPSYTTSPAGLNVWISYNGSTTPPVAAGSYAVVATIIDPNYAGSATSTLVINKAAQTITFPNPGAKQFTSPPFTLEAVSDSGLPVSYVVVSGPATVSGNEVTLTGAGAVVIRASQSGGTNYLAASDVDVTFNVEQAPQTISVQNPGPKVYGDPAFSLSGVATSGLPVSYSVVSGPGTVNGNMVTITGQGAIVIQASQAGDANYTAAPNVELTISVAPGAAAIVLSNLTQAYDGLAKTVTVTTNPAGLAVTTTYNNSSTAPKLPGTYAVVATINNPNYVGSATGTLIVRTTALVRHAPTIDGEVDGSVQLILGENVTLNGSAGILSDLLVPGTPTVQLSGQPSFGGVHDETGNVNPQNYKVTLSGGALLRFLVRRVDPVSMPTATAPATPLGTRDVQLNSPSASPGNFATLRDLTINGGHPAPVAVPPGAYRNLTANSGGFVLGVAGSTSPTIYSIQRLVLNGNTTLRVVGPVILRLANSLSTSASVGEPSDPSLLTIELAAAGVTLNDGGELSGTVVAPNGTIAISDGAVINGNIAADRLTINDGGLLDDALAQP